MEMQEAAATIVLPTHVIPALDEKDGLMHRETRVQIEEERAPRS
jgi:hypothetical protein